MQERCAALEAELRRSKRREEKLAALHFRLKEDVRTGGGDVRWGLTSAAAVAGQGQGSRLPSGAGQLAPTWDTGEGTAAGVQLQPHSLPEVCASLQQQHAIDVLVIAGWTCAASSAFTGAGNSTPSHWSTLPCSALERLQDTRALEYELDFEKNRADRDAKVTAEIPGPACY